MGASGARPAPHWDAALAEQIAPTSLAALQVGSFHVGDSFTDVARTSSFNRYVETVFHHGIMEPCAPGLFCAVEAVTREEMAPFVLKAFQPGFVPQPCVPGSEMFVDVPASSTQCRWIEELARRSVVAGCGNGHYCPQLVVSREALAVYLLVTREGAGYAPPACGAPLFGDVPATSSFCRWVEELARRGIVTGCGNGNYCPGSGVTREQMSVFLSVTFGLTLYAP